ncbi:uncharacterized protein LOC133920011 isoform X2 [Phragmites australis]|uniref:uncharacterized protein LOC133920011 isoform X2 n=1 Tax=Phragmites australis TaxID=29695 RepID=UPI002D786075|nr:uncharacterized protein LOC133920011 isoform X2 [Phragmites australis]
MRGKRWCDLVGFTRGRGTAAGLAMALPVSLVRLSLLLLVALPFCATHPGPSFHAPREFQRALDSDRYGLVARRSIAEAPVDTNITTNSSFVLAADRTYRKDPLNGFRKYPGGWNISELHYWAVSFNTTSAGCVMLYDGQGKFHKSTTTTLKFVVSQANYTVDNLSNLSDSLSAAKKVDIGRFLLPSDVQNQINDIQGKLNSSATDLATRTTDNSEKINKLLNQVRVALIVIAAVMLLLAFIGFLLSIFGLEFLVSVLVVIGWILVTGTFILCGVFLLLHNVVSDTCVAMDEWVAHPTEHTALDDIIPCVEPATANESLYRSRQVTFQLVNLVNQVITNVSNRNFPPMTTPFYYNQSGPLMPTLCNPFTPDLSNRTCTRGEVTLDNATQVWKSFECQTTTVSGAEICTTVGRVTPRIYGQMAAGVNVSQGLYQYGPFLIQLEDCTFVRDTFTTINLNYCPGLQRYSKWVYVGLVMVSSAVMLSLIFWVIYARERRHRAYNKHFIAGHQQYPMEDKPAPTVPNA